MKIITKHGYTFQDVDVKSWAAADPSDPFAAARMITHIRRGVALPSDFGTRDLQESHELATGSGKEIKTYSYKRKVQTHHP